MSLKAEIYKDFGSFKLDIAFETGDDTLALLGASGCGKSLTLKCIAGIEKPDRGHIELDGRVLFDSESKINLSPQQRRTGLMFQNYALFPNMNVLQNIRCGAKREKDAEIRDKNVKRVMESFDLEPLAQHLPSQLSGGQQQRVALARILVSQPDVLLLDEPFSALDSHLRFKLESELRRVMREFGRTVILVSHDRDEVFRLSSRVAVMNSGHIERIGSGAEVFGDPGTINGARLTGCKNISPIRRIDDETVEATDWGLRLKVLPGHENAKAVGIRMHDLSSGGEENRFEFELCEELENPFSSMLMLRGAGTEARELLGYELPREQREQISGDKISLSLPKEKLLLLDE